MRGGKLRSISAASGAALLLVSGGMSAASVPAQALETTKPSTETPAGEAGKIAWKRCNTGMQCGELAVPLDYKDEKKGTIDLAISRRPADDQKHKLGVLFVNPGGPGGSAVSAVGMFSSKMGRDIRKNFDIVGVDPRGIGGSDLALCKMKANDIAEEGEPYPISPEQIAKRKAHDEKKRKACEDSKTRILPYMTTADVARDMDRVREVLGQKVINYYGISYGTQLGNTYAAMFPNRVRTMVIDGVLDPVQWSTGDSEVASKVPSTTRIRSGVGAHQAMKSAISECERVGSDCEQSDTIRNDWNYLTSRLRGKSVILEGPFGSKTFTYQDLFATSTSMLYGTEAIPDLLAFISSLRADVEKVKDTSSQAAGKTAQKASEKSVKYYGKLLDHERRMKRDLISYDPPAPISDSGKEESLDVPFGFEGVLCSETNNPSTFESWPAAAKIAEQAAPGFGPLWTWNSSICSGWKFKGANAYKGPYTSSPAGGMLVMSTLEDPATPYSGAKAVRSLVKNSRLITVPTWGHGVVDSSECAEKARNDYFLSGKLPSKDMTCRPDHRLFTPLD
ncbi:alpha/beta hydrolase [Dermatophilus congolensis]|uniref:Tripeptidyl aminopeptidase n=1 Tax=Dermatophilus congolensis TaxID=1863 RepID=A0A239V926_9MICO|nr:alpha/beta hydrolase [Dermatophilus congolensis]MBO3130548.1 alpha/beta hydrolase [Dermatophilus congolensis]MBO3130822.1 alpha/beta hydrolase [Dermatophilus congolensis]MBO3135020.1 alpha/beta hydrolase [Dermatophilus congolensis]MBO3137259.1 alpha/beta hydrolase [Dermatophilus congolensis]MBO3139504.1 alpha/beta hydrolase [Dermatophilus congolensis]